MPEVKPVIEAVNAPVVLFVPKSVLLSAMVGIPVVFHTTPYAVGLGTPNAVTLPFPVAAVIPMDVTS